MPCKKCSSIKLYRSDSLVCPKCNGFNTLGSEDAKIISKKRVDFFHYLWKTELEKTDQQTLVLHIAHHRETTSRKFFKEYSVMELGKYFSDTLFLKRVLEIAPLEGGEIIDSLEKSKPLIELFNQTIKVETDNLLINSGYANIIYKKNFDIQSISDQDLLSNFELLQNENYIDLVKSYENYGLFTEEDGRKKIQEHMNEFNELMNEKLKSKVLTRDEFIEKNYDIISSLYLALLRNELFAETFDIRDYQKILNDPSELTRFIHQFPFDSRGVTTCDTDDFITRLMQFFKQDKELLKNIFLFDNKNRSIFPLFVRFQRDNQDFVIISQAFTIFIYILLHAIITREKFIRETEKRSKKFEQTVKQKFENLGFNYLLNFEYDINSKSFEIDGIAIKGDNCFIIECKKPRLPPLAEAQQTRVILIEDIKGIIDGFKRVPKDGKHEIIKRPSLIEKIDHVSKNLSLLSIKTDKIKSINGIVITLDNPFLTEYKGIKVIPINKIEHELTIICN